MNAKHYLTHLVLQHKLGQEVPSAREAIVKHARETLSAEHVTQALKDRLLRKRKREALLEELQRVKQELSHLDVQDTRVQKLQKKVKELESQLGPIGPSP